MAMSKVSKSGQDYVSTYFYLRGKNDIAYNFLDCKLDILIQYLNELRETHMSLGHSDISLEISDPRYEDDSIEIKLNYFRQETDDEFGERKKKTERDRISKEKRSKAAKLAIEKREKETFERLKKKFEGK